MKARFHKLIGESKVLDIEAALGMEDFFKMRLELYAILVLLLPLAAFVSVSLES